MLPSHLRLPSTQLVRTRRAGVVSRFVCAVTCTAFHIKVMSSNMPFQKGKPRHPKAGRKKGTPNKLSADTKEVFRLAAEGAGGVEALTRFAIEEPKSFWPLYSKLIPMDVTSDGKPVEALTAINIRLIRPKKDE
jgi:hypothetical protein